MKLLNKLLPVFFLLPMFSPAQSNYRAGYVVTTAGDTVRGFIDYRNWDSNPSAILFKSALNDPRGKKLTPSDISLFTVPGYITYKRFVCSVSLDETNTAHIGSARDTSYKIDTVFLKVLEQGKRLALYAYADQIKTRFYIGEYPDYVPVELIYRLYNNSGISTDENTYLKQLFALAAKYNALDDDLNRDFGGASYTAVDIFAIVGKINGISKDEIKKTYAAHSRFNLFISGAVNISNTTSDVGSSYSAGGGVPYTSYLPAASVGVSFMPNANVGRVALRVGLSVAQTQFRAMYQLKVSPFIPVKATFDQLALSVTPEVIYYLYNAENFKIYGGVGLVITGFSYSNARFGGQNPAVPDGNIGSTEPFYFNSSDGALKLQAGVQLAKKFEIFANYFTSTATTKGGYWKLSTQNSQIGVLFLIGK
jgi:hypothetical protein